MATLMRAVRHRTRPPIHKVLRTPPKMHLATMETQQDPAPLPDLSSLILYGQA